MAKIPAIPTKFNGIQYRSLLEAKWACFFQSIFWKVQYEPYELNGWIPDFLILGEIPVLVEVKPFEKLEEFTEEIKKITNAISGTVKEGTDILLVGTTVLTYENIINGTSIGWLGCWLEDEYEFGDALFVERPNNWGLIHETLDFTDRISGIHDDGINTVNRKMLDKVWKEACNATQWTPQ